MLSACPRRSLGTVSESRTAKHLSESVPPVRFVALRAQNDRQWGEGGLAAGAAEEDVGDAVVVAGNQVVGPGGEANEVAIAADGGLGAAAVRLGAVAIDREAQDRKSTRLNSSHGYISY